MAQRRMFSPQIVGSDAFLDMPTSSRELYFQLGMYADDDGFVNPRRVMRMVSASDDDLKLLIAKRFLIVFETGVVVIKHWLVHNLIRSDRYKETMYLEEKNKLSVKENRAYTELGLPDDNQRVSQVRLGKDSIGKEIELPLWLNKEVWEEWIQHRKEIRKKMTPMTIKKQLKFLFIHKEDHVKIINHSIKNGWSGLFELKKDFKREIPRRDEEQENNYGDFSIKDKLRNFENK